MTEKVEFPAASDDWEPIILGWPVVPGEFGDGMNITIGHFSFYAGRDERDIRAQKFAARCMDDD